MHLVGGKWMKLSFCVVCILKLLTIPQRFTGICLGKQNVKRKTCFVTGGQDIWHTVEASLGLLGDVYQAEEIVQLLLCEGSWICVSLLFMYMHKLWPNTASNKSVKVPCILDPTENHEGVNRMHFQAITTYLFLSNDLYCSFKAKQKKGLLAFSFHWLTSNVMYK